MILDFEDGTEALYLHLQKGSLLVEAGDRVERGQRLGKIGKSGWICGQVNEGVHLHFHIQRTCASWYCQSFQTNFDMIGPLSYGDSIESMNCPREVSCALGAEGGVIDDQDPCFRRATQWWWTEPSGGWQDSWQYTYAIDAPESDTQAWWRFEIEQADDYVVEAHIPLRAQSQRARYYIHLDGQELGPFQIDQTAQTGWVELTTLAMSAGAAGDVNLRDNTGEPYSEEGKRRIAFDAVRLRPAQDVVTMPEDMGAPVDPGEPDMGPGPEPEPTPTPDMGAPSDPGEAPDLGAGAPAPGPGEGQQPTPPEDRMGERGAR